MRPMRNRPIAVFDSGLGGISVLRELIRQMPREDFLYFGDSANAPYGSRSTQEIRALTEQHARNLFDRGAKALVIACNTATSAAVRELREKYPDKIIIGIEPALKPAADAFPGGTLLVMATDATLREAKFDALMTKFQGNCTILKCPCPGLVEFVERGELEGSDLHSRLREILAPYPTEKVDAVVLGCTHYPFLKKAIREVLGERPLLLDGADGTAKETRRRLAEAGLLRTEGAGAVWLESSLPSPRILTLGKTLLQLP